MKISLNELRAMISEMATDWKWASSNTPCEICGAPGVDHPDWGDICKKCYHDMENPEVATTVHSDGKVTTGRDK